jgi:hypothetical protein
MTMLIFVECDGLIRSKVEVLPMVFGKRKRFIVQIGLEDRLKLVHIKLFSKRSVFQCLRQCLPWSPVPLQFDDDITGAVESEEVNRGAEIRVDLPPNDKELAVFKNPIRVFLQPILKNCLLVLGLERRRHILPELPIWFYAVHLHGLVFFKARPAKITPLMRLSLCGYQRGEEGRPDNPWAGRLSPLYITGCGARVARQRCPILRAGRENLPRTALSIKLPAGIRNAINAPFDKVLS